MASDLRQALEDRTSRPEVALEIKQPKPQIKEERGKRPGVRTDVQKPRGRGRTVLLLMLLSAAILVGVVFGGIAIYRQVMTSVKVPEVTGMTLEEAEKYLGREGLSANPVYVSSDEYDAGTVFCRTRFRIPPPERATPCC